MTQSQERVWRASAKSISLSLSKTENSPHHRTGSLRVAKEDSTGCESIKPNLLGELSFPNRQKPGCLLRRELPPLFLGSPWPWTKSRNIFRLTGKEGCHDVPPPPVPTVGAKEEEVCS